MKPEPTRPAEVGCLLPDRLWKVAFGMDLWTAAEGEHLRGCTGCRGRFLGLVKRLNQPRPKEAAAFLMTLFTYLAVKQVARFARAGRFDTGPLRELPKERL